MEMGVALRNVLLEVVFVGCNLRFKFFLYVIMVGD